jgi:hypothetical protein
VLAKICQTSIKLQALHALRVHKNVAPLKCIRHSDNVPQFFALPHEPLRGLNGFLLDFRVRKNAAPLK